MNDFLDKPDLEFTEIDTNDNIKNNFLNIGRNFTNLTTWLSNLKIYLEYLYSLINVDVMTKNVALNLAQQKIKIVIPTSISYDTPFEYNDISNGINFEILKSSIDNNDVYTIKNISTNNWNVDNLIVYVKNTITGYKINPDVYTINNEINILFLGTNNQNLTILVV